MNKYYLHDGTDQRGPFDFEYLKAKNISRDTPIWYEGLSEWTTAGNVDDLKSLFVAIPPPFSVSKVQLNPIQKNQEQKIRIPLQTIKRKNILGTILQSIGVIGAIIVILFFIDRYMNYGYSGVPVPDTQSYEEKVMTVEEIESSRPCDFLNASGNYNENFLGNKLKVHGIITNNATVATYKDAIVKVTYYSKTKTELGSKKYTIYEIFPPNSTKEFELKIENYRNVSSIGWDVIDASAN